MCERKLGEILKKRHLVDEVTLKAALDMQRATGDRLGTTLLKLELIDAGMLSCVLAEQQGVEGIDPTQVRSTPEACRLLSFDQAMALGALPLWIEDDVVAVAMADPTDTATVARLEELTGRQLKLYVAPQMALYRSLKRAYGDGASANVGALRLRKIATTLRSLAQELDCYLDGQEKDRT